MPGIVQKKYCGSVKIFWLNKEALHKELLKKAEKCAALNKDIKKRILFGSVANQKATPFSDIDIAIIVSKESMAFLDRSAYYREYFPGLDMDVDIFVYTREEFKNSSFQSIILKEGKVLFEHP